MVFGLNLNVPQFSVSPMESSGENHCSPNVEEKKKAVLK